MVCVSVNEVEKQTNFEKSDLQIYDLNLQTQIDKVQ